MSGATILRKRVRSGFTQVPNETIRDSGLSFKAVGVLVHMLSLPDGAQISADKLAEQHKEGRSAILSALQELRDGGYYRTIKQRGADGRLFTVCEVADERGKLAEDTSSAPPETTDQPSTEAPEFDYPTSAEPTSDNPPPKEEDLLEIPTNTPCSPPATTTGGQPSSPPAECDHRRRCEHFEAFWDRYPRRVGLGAALKAYRRAATHATTEEILEGLDRSVKAWRAEQRAPRFLPHPATWLNQQRWLDDDPEPSTELSKRAQAEAQLVSEAEKFLSAPRPRPALPGPTQEVTDGVA